MDSYATYCKAMNLIQMCGTRDALRIADDLGITVFYNNNYKNLLGMYMCRQRHRMIFLNGRLDEIWLPLVAAHELGHDMLHRDIARSGLMQEFILFHMKNTTEYEANAFASHLLLDNEEVYELVREGYDVVQIAQAMNSHINLVLIKLQEMNKLGYDLRVPVEPDGRFLRKIRQ